MCVHTFADFIMQAEQWAVNKSKSNKALLAHVSTYSVVWFLPMIAIFANEIPGKQDTLYFQLSAIFCFVTFCVHFVTDWITSRIVSKKFANKEFGSSIPNFGVFTIIQFDQMFHYAQLFLTFHLLIETFK